LFSVLHQYIYILVGTCDLRALWSRLVFLFLPPEFWGKQNKTKAPKSPYLQNIYYIGQVQRGTKLDPFSQLLTRSGPKELGVSVFVHFAGFFSTFKTSCHNGICRVQPGVYIVLVWGTDWYGRNITSWGYDPEVCTLIIAGTCLKFIHFSGLKF
jgi:hypothetical protein